MALTQISTDGIKNGTITNADLASNAAIDGSKINTATFNQSIVTSSNQIRVNKSGSTAVDGFMGEAYSNYFGLKHSDQTFNSEYMILSQDNHTYISASTGSNVYIRAGGNSADYQLIVGAGNSALTWRGFKVWHENNDGGGSGLDADTLDGISSGQFLRSDATDTCSGQITFTNQIISKADGDKSTQGGSALVLTHNTTPALRANHFIHDDFPSGSGTYYIQVTESGVSNDRNMCLQGYGGKVKIGGAGNAPTETLDVAGTFKVSSTSTFGGDATFSGGAGAVTVNYASDIRLLSGNWTGDFYGKIQNHANRLYFGGGSNTDPSIVFRYNASDRIYMTSGGTLYPTADSTSDLGKPSVRWANGYFDTLYGDGSNLTGISSVGGATGVDFNDDVKARFGTGNDLEIYHDGSHSYIADVGTGNLSISSSAGEIQLAFNDFAGNFEHMVQCNPHGSVNLYHDNSLKLATFSGGISVTGQVNSDGSHMGDSDKALFGNSNDLQIYHDGTNSLIQNSTGYLELNANAAAWLKTTQFNVIDNDATQYHLRTFKDGAVELYHNNSKKLETISGGISITGGLNTSAASTMNQTTYNSGAGAITIAANSDIRLTNGSWTGESCKIQHHDNRLYIQGGSNGIQLRGSDGGGIVNFTNTSGTFFDAVTFNGDVSCSGGAGAVSINGGSDIRFTSGTWTGNSGSTPKIQAHSNYLYIVGGPNGIIFREDGTDRWYVDGSGHFRPATNNTYDIGTTSHRVRNIYTNDLNLSNEGSSNDVDGTWGSYTIQEGAEDLFLVNRRNGKKYKFNLTEVS